MDCLHSCTWQTPNEGRMAGLFGLEILSLLFWSADEHFGCLFQWYALLRSDTSSTLAVNAQLPKKNLLLDLDETLVHSSIKRPSRYSFKLNVMLGKMQTEFYVVKRPYMDRFLRKVRAQRERASSAFALATSSNSRAFSSPRPRSDPALLRSFHYSQVCQWYNVYIFTAGVKDYAGPLLLRLDPQNLVSGRFFRDVCPFAPTLQLPFSRTHPF